MRFCLIICAMFVSTLFSEIKCSGQESKLESGQIPSSQPVGNSAFDSEMSAQQKAHYPSELELLSSPSIQKDLELVDEQKQRIEMMNAEYGDTMVEAMKQLRNGSLSGKAYTENLIELKAKQAVELENLILPHQVQRLRQIRTQTYLGRAGLAGGLLNKKIANPLSITDEQKLELKKLKKEFNERMKKTIAKLNDEHKKEILNVLSSEQKDKLTDLVGDKLVAQKPDSNQRR